LSPGDWVYLPGWNLECSVSDPKQNIGTSASPRSHYRCFNTSVGDILDVRSPRGKTYDCPPCSKKAGPLVAGPCNESILLGGFFRLMHILSFYAGRSSYSSWWRTRNIPCAWSCQRRLAFAWTISSLLYRCWCLDPTGSRRLSVSSFE